MPDRYNPPMSVCSKCGRPYHGLKKECGCGWTAPKGGASHSDSNCRVVSSGGGLPRRARRQCGKCDMLHDANLAYCPIYEKEAMEIEKHNADIRQEQLKQEKIKTEILELQLKALKDNHYH